MARRILRDEAMTTVVVGKPAGVVSDRTLKSRAAMTRFYRQSIDDALDTTVGDKGLSHARALDRELASCAPALDKIRRWHDGTDCRC